MAIIEILNEDTDKPESRILKLLKDIWMHRSPVYVFQVFINYHTCSKVAKSVRNSKLKKHITVLVKLIFKADLIPLIQFDFVKSKILVEPKIAFIVFVLLDAHTNHAL